jgi:hypothetical protein
MMNEIAKCHYCGSERDYQIMMLHTGLRQNLFIVECGNCKHDIIPIVVDYFLPDEKLYKKCRIAWNKVNAVPNVKLSGCPIKE